MTELKELLAAIATVKELKNIVASHEQSIAELRGELQTIQTQLKTIAASQPPGYGA